MFVNVHHDSPAEHRRLVLAGVAMLLSVALLVALSLAMYTKAFEDVVTVTLKADRAGLQLAENGDVRQHGVLIGRVTSVEQDGEQASIELALQPEAAAKVPGNARVQIVPTTLFGQKFVSFLDPRQPGEPIRDGAVIPADRVQTNVELSAVLADLFPLLRSVSPTDLNTTLHAIATALTGRGDRIGELLVDLDGYVGRVNQKLPELRRDLQLLAEVSRAYELSSDDLLRLMRNATVTARTLTEERDQLDAFLGDITGMADVTARILRDNEAGIIRLGQVSEPTLRLLATYSPEYPCLLKGLDRYTGHLSQIFAGGRVSQLMTLKAPQRGVYTQADKPEYGEIGHGPWCLGLPNPPVPAPPVPLRDGSDKDNPRVAPRLGEDRGFVDPTSGWAGNPIEQQLVSTLLSADSGRSATAYTGFSTLLAGPQLRGTELAR